MKLKTRVASLDEVPEQYRDRYKQIEDGSWTVEELDIEDVTGLKKNHEKLLKSYGATQDEIRKLKEQYEGIDPEAARGAQKKLEELENKTLMDEGKFEELFMKRTEAMKGDHERQVSLLTKKIEAEAARAATLEKQLQKTMISNQLSLEAPKRGINPDMLPFLQLAVEKDWSLDDEGKPVWKQNGDLRFSKDGLTPATMSDYLEELTQKVPSLLMSSTGTGANGNTRTGTGTFSISKREAEQNPGKYRAIVEQAKQQGIDPLQIQVTE